MAPDTFVVAMIGLAVGAVCLLSAWLAWVAPEDGEQEGKER